MPGQAVFGVGAKRKAGGLWAGVKYARECGGPGCGRVFAPVRSDQRYCSPACRQAAYRRR